MSMTSVVFVPSAVVDKALVHDMVYAGCPRCSKSLGGCAATGSVSCSACGAALQATELQYKYRLKLQVLHDCEVEGAMMFDEAARAFLGVPAAQYKRSLLPQYPQLPFVLADMIEGLHVAFHCQRQVSANPNFTKDLKIVRLTPLVRELLPRPAVILALEVLRGQQNESTQQEEKWWSISPPSDDFSDLSGQ